MTSIKTAVLTAIVAGSFALCGGMALAKKKQNETPKVSPAKVDAVVKASFKAEGEWAARLVQDETQRLCSVTHNRPSAAQAEEILAREKALVKVPADSVLGDWKEGEKVAQNGRGGQFSDPPGTVSGGNCYACHQMDPKELSYGTLGPSLSGYGAVRNFSPEEAKTAYIRVYNPQATSPCSNMPRFGVHGVLSEKQIKDVVAYLFDPESPVNKNSK